MTASEQTTGPEAKTLPSTFPGLQAGLAAILLCLSGGPIGFAFLVPEAAWVAWLGVAMLAWGLKFEVGRGWLIFGVITGGFISHWLGHPWYLESVVRWSQGLWPLWQVALLWFVSSLFAVVVPERLLILLWICLPKRPKIPVFCWLPLAWLLGEALVFWSFHLCQHFIFYSQWQIQLVLKAVGHLGWTPALMICIALAAALGEGIYVRSYKLPMLAICGGFLLGLLPPLPQKGEMLKGFGAVYLQNYIDLPAQVPEQVNILVWPEVALSRRPRIQEGLNQNISLPPPVPTENTWHLTGYKTLSRLGLQNGLLVQDPQGTARGMRAKQLLFPGWERPILGFGAPNTEYFVPGKQPPMLEIAGRKVVPLLCLEEFDRHLAQQGKQAGGEILTISAIDYGMTQSELGHQQFIGISVLMAVELGLPLVRSSLGGPAAMIDANGEVLLSSPFHQRGILVYP